MIRAALLALALWSSGCGLASKDVEISQNLTAGGGPPTADPSFDSAKLLAPLSADVSKLSSVTLTAARLEALDNQGLDFVSAVTLTLSGNGLPSVDVAQLTAAPTATQLRADLSVAGRDLKPYLQAGGLLGAKIDYSPRPVTARSLRLTLTLHGSLL